MWGKIDDGWARNRKIRRASMEAKVFWVTAFAEANRANSDGVLDDMVAEDAALLARVELSEVTAELVGLELLHTPAELRKCKLCRDELDGRKVPEGAWYFHGWRKCNYTKDELTDPREKFIAKRHKALHNNRSLCELVYERDGDICRYCGTRFEGGTNKTLSRTLDHVDPDGPNEAWNLAASHRVCNGRKGHRFPWEAGMFLLPPAYPHGRDGTGRRIPDPSYEGQNPGLLCDPATGLPWGQQPVDRGLTQRSTEGEHQGQPDGQQPADPAVDLSSRAHATRDQVGLGSAPGRPQGQPEVNPGSTHDASTNPDGQVADLLQLPQEAL